MLMADKMGRGWEFYTKQNEINNRYFKDIVK